MTGTTRQDSGPGPFFMMAVERGGRLYAVHGGTTIATGATLRTTVRVNTPLEEDEAHDWLAPQTVRGAGPGAAPENLWATVKHANGIAFTWTDRAGDEEGHLLEVRAKDAPG
ncbi:hypothetical protein [Nonomuraea endophytica]|uniref:hypothetical protein n=1 Tax=Nonomuraea endophytica TaxID=714136 RepID=UPI0037CBD030